MLTHERDVEPELSSVTARRAPGAAYELILWLLLLKGHSIDEGLPGLELKQVEFHISFFWHFNEGKTAVREHSFGNVPRKMA